ncbi:MAG: calycin-like domain-containing protein [Clostridium sp.]|nr:calycin-like domain-containing protein [Clostridium sp.]
MKKTLLLMFAFVAAVMVQAQSTVTYTDDLVVTINEESTPAQKTEIKVTTNTDGTYALALDNFMLGAGEDVLPVGNIVLDNITGEEQDGIVKLNVTRIINIQPGTMEGITEDSWLGPMLGDVPVSLVAEMTADKLHCLIDIDMMSTLEQIIKVSFGTPFGASEEPGVTVTYTDDLVVTINEESTPAQKTEIKVTTNADGTYALALDNFMLGAGEDVLPVGNIVLDNITGEEQDGIVKLNVTRIINIQPGTMEGITEDSWLGPMLGDVPVSLVAEMTADKLHCLIDIDMMSTLEQIIKVSFGTPFNGTGIQNVVSSEKAAAYYYSLDGVLMGTDWTQLSKGIYVINGKKIIK